MAETIGFLILTAADFAVTAGAVEGASLAASATVAAAVGGQTIFAGLTVAGAVGGAALFAASVAVAFATAPEVPKAGDGSQAIRQSIPPRPFGYGRTRVAGAYMLYEVDPSNDDSHDVVAFHQGGIAGVVHVYLNDDVVEISASTDYVIGILNGPSDARYEANAGGAANSVNVQYRLGASTETAYADVITAMPTLWTSSHRGDDVASLMLRCENTATANIPKLYPRGLPRPSVVGDLAPVWDPRDTGQSRADATTWTVSSNPVLQLLDYLTHDDRGPALDYTTLIEPNIDDWMDEADICDEAATKADGSTEPRYRSDGWAFLTTDPAEVIGAILATCDGWLTEGGDGTLELFVGKLTGRTLAITFNDDHIVGFDIDKGVPDEDLVNEVQFTYTAPQANWRDCPGVAMRDETAITDAGVVRSTRLQLSWVQSHSQGRRLAKRMLARHTAAARGSITTTLYGLRALGQRWVRVSSRLVTDLADAVIEITRARIDLANARVTFEWTLVDEATVDAWDETTEEGEAPSYFPVPTNVAAVDPGAGTTIRVDFDELDPVQDWLYYVIDYRVGTSGAWSRKVVSASLLTDAGTTLRYTIGGLSAATYSVRIAATGQQVLGPSTNIKTDAARATTANIVLSGEQSIDGALTSASRVLVKDQTTKAENGIYTTGAGAWTRVTDFNAWDEVVDAQVTVTDGTVNIGTVWKADVAASGTVGVTDIEFVSDVVDPDLVWSPDVDGVTGVVVS